MTLTRPPRRSSTHHTPFVAVPRHISDELFDSARDATRHIREESDSVHDTQERLLSFFGRLRDEMIAQINDDGGGGGSGPSRSTAAAALDNLPRIHLTDKHSFFRKATLEVAFVSSDESNSSSHTLQAVPAEFGDDGIVDLEDAVLIIAEPRTGEGGTLSETTVRDVERSKEAGRSVILFMERGDGVTFCQKALLAQGVGASAVVIGNHVAEPWPYAMKDFNNEADTYSLTLPVVMVKQSDGQAIQSRATTTCKARLRIQTHALDCVICTESFQADQTALRIPACGHVFHESCALQWLGQHNTCPYCRRELPTNDDEYERERRRAQRTHAGSESATSNRTGDDFYG